MAKKEKAKAQGVSIENRKARHDYFIEDTLECGIELKGNEVKSIKSGKVSLKESWIDISNNQLIIKQMHIAKYNTAKWQSELADSISETRDRVLLAHKYEIRKLNSKIQLEGYTLVPLKIYISNNKVKVLIAVSKGKHNYDKRASLKDKQVKLDIKRALKR